MKPITRSWLGLVTVMAVVTTVTIHLRPSPTSAQAPMPDAAVLVGRAISTQVVTIKVENQRGEPRTFTGRAKFDQPVQAYWLAVVGQDIKFTGTMEKQVNRVMFAVDPFAKIINGTEVEVSGKLGIRDGSGDWDDGYEGTLTVAVTVITAGR